MPFCKNCGKEMNEIDEYCVNCGAKANGEEVKAPAKPGKNNEIFTHASNLLRGMIEKPIDAAKEFEMKAKRETLILVTAVLALLQGLLGLWKVSQMMGQFEKSATSFLTQLEQMNSIFGNELGGASDAAEMTRQFASFKKMLTVPKGAIFGQNILVYLLGLVLLLAIILVINAAFYKKQLDAKKVYAVILACSVPLIYGEILAIIMCYASMKIGAMILLLGMLVSMACLVIVAREDMIPQGQGAVWIVAIAEVLMIMILMLVAGRFIKSDMTAAFSGAMNNLLKGAGL